MNRLIFSRPQLDRLEIELERLRHDLATQRCNGSRPEHELDSLDAIIRKAEIARKKKDANEGWGYAHLAGEELVYGYDDARVREEARQLLEEASVSDKFTAWRKKAIVDFLSLVDPSAASPAGGTDDAHHQADSSDLAKSRLTQAMRVQHGQYATDYWTLAILRWHQLLLVIIGVVVLLGVVVFLLVRRGEITTDRLGAAWVGIGCMLLGVLGATVSAGQRSTKMTGHRIPRQIGSAEASLSRVPIGAVAGLLAWLAALVADTALAHPVPQVLILAFGAGFSERLIVNQPETRG